MEWLRTLGDLLSPGWLGALVGIGGIVAAIFTYLLTRQRTILAYQLDSTRLLGGPHAGLPEEVTLHYRQEAITALSRSTVVFWNLGEKTITKDDLTTNDPLRAAVNEQCKILSVTVRGVSRQVIQFACSMAANSNQAVLTFEFLDRYDGATIEILHTDDERSLKIAGTVRGIPRGLKFLGAANALQSVRGIQILACITAVLSFGAAIYQSVVSFAPNEVPPWPRSLAGTDQEYIYRLTQVVPPLCLALGALYLLHRLRRRYPKTLVVTGRSMN